MVDRISVPDPGRSTHAAAPVDKSAARLEASRQFEALVIGNLLKSCRGEGAGWFGADDAAASSVMEMATEQFAQMLAAQGGLGLARVVADGLEAKAADSSAPRNQSAAARQ